MPWSVSIVILFSYLQCQQHQTYCFQVLSTTFEWNIICKWPVVLHLSFLSLCFFLFLFLFFFVGGVAAIYSFYLDRSFDLTCIFLISLSCYSKNVFFCFLALLKITPNVYRLFYLRSIPQRI